MLREFAGIGKNVGKCGIRVSFFSGHRSFHAGKGRFDLMGFGLINAADDFVAENEHEVSGDRPTTIDASAVSARPVRSQCTVVPLTAVTFIGRAIHMTRHSFTGTAKRMSPSRQASASLGRSFS